MKEIMNTIRYSKETSLTHFMDEFSIQRLQRTIEFEKSCTPKNTELIEACETVITHLKAVWNIK